MALSRFPSHLTLVAPALALRPLAPDPTRIHPERLPAAELDPETGIVTRHAMLERLEVMGELALTAPLSFLVIHIDGPWRTDGTDGPPVAAVAGRVRELTRPIDCLGRLRADCLGVILQGTGVTAAGAVAARLSHHLNRIPEVSPHFTVSVSAATGTGRNARTLPSAAMDAFEAWCC